MKKENRETNASQTTKKEMEMRMDDDEGQERVGDVGDVDDEVGSGCSHDMEMVGKQ